MAITRLSGGLTPGDGSDPRTFPAIWNATATDLEGTQATVVSQGTAITGLQLKNIPAFGTAVPVNGQLLSYSTATSSWNPGTAVVAKLDDIGDVTIGTAVANGQVLSYSTAVSGWVNTAPAGGGKILQVVQTLKTDSFSTTSTSFVDVTGVSVSITPSATNSKVLVFVSGITGNNNASFGQMMNLVRGATNIAQSTGSSSSDQTLGAYTASASSGDTFTISFLDSPNTTSVTTYKIQLRALGGTAYVGRFGASDAHRTVTTITVMEVAA